MNQPTDLEMELQQWFSRTGKQTLRELGVRAGDVALDLGCGPGRFTVPLAQAVSPGGKVMAVDRNPDALNQLTERLEAWASSCQVQCVRTDGPGALKALDDRSLDVVLLFDVLQHMEDWDALLDHLSRAIKPDGLLLVYPAAVPHPGRVDMDRFGALAEDHGFQAAGRRDVRLPHAYSVVDDKVYLFRRLAIR